MRRLTMGLALSMAFLTALFVGSAWAQGQVTGSINAEDQNSDGSTVTVSQASISGANGWVAIHQMDSGGKPGGVIGQTFIQEGDSSNVAVQLNQPLTSSTTVMAMLHVDDPADQNYTFPQDNSTDGPVMANGQAVVKPFEVTVGGQQGGRLVNTGGPSPLMLALFGSGAVLISLGATAGYFARRRPA